MSDCGVTTLAPHHVCSSAPHMAPEILPPLALVNLDTAEMVLMVGSDTPIHFLGPKALAHPLVFSESLMVLSIPS